MAHGKFLLVTALLTIGCSNDNFKIVDTDPLKTTGSGLSTCHNFEGVSQKLKIITVVDNSGSTDATDPTKDFRGKILNHFVTDFSAKTNFTWNLSYFAGSSAKSVIYQSDDQHPTFTNADNMKTGINQYLAIAAGGSTPYKAALQMVKSAIQNDSDYLSDKKNTNYVVVFMSDGMPTDFGDPVDEFELQKAVVELMLLSPGRLTLSTIYFNLSPDPELSVPTAITTLQRMAITGGGQFANTLVEGPHVKLQKIATVPPAICQP